MLVMVIVGLDTAWILLGLGLGMSCEKMCLALEQMEPDKDMENFVRDYSTGNLIPNPPTFVNYRTPDAIPSSSLRPTTRPAQFIRSSSRPSPVRQNPVQQEEEPTVGAAGVGAGGGSRRGDPQADAPLSCQPTQNRGGAARMHNMPSNLSPSMDLLLTATVCFRILGSSAVLEAAND